MTRPRHQAEPFCLQLEQLGAQVYRFPVIEIEGITPDPALLHPTKSYDMLIFTSSNAVHGAAALLDNLNTPGCQIAAIGKKTAQTLHQTGFTIHIQPQQTFNSESLLALPTMQAVADKHILIIKGEGGRQLLQKTLQRRGAIVDCLAVYRRRKPVASQSLLNRLKTAKIDIITLTSAESGINLLTMLNAQHYPWLSTATLLLGSKRIQNVLNRKKLNNPMLVANNPSDATMVEALLDLSQDYNRIAP